MKWNEWIRKQWKELFSFFPIDSFLAWVFLFESSYDRIEMNSWFKWRMEKILFECEFFEKFYTTIFFIVCWSNRFFPSIKYYLIDFYYSYFKWIGSFLFSILMMTIKIFQIIYIFFMISLIDWRENQRKKLLKN